MIDVVYTLSNESKNDNKELKYSLRSLSNFRHLGKVFIVGYKPIWLNDENIIHIHTYDPHKHNKDANLIQKLVLACCDERLSDEFIWFSDDQLLLIECSKEDFKPYIDNSHINFRPNERLNRWQGRLKRTIDILKERGFRHDCYEAHIPYLFNKKEYPKILLSYDYGVDIGYCGNTLYFNSNYAQGIDTSLNKPFGRLNVLAGNKEQINNICDGKMFFNYSQDAENEILFLYLQEKFPNKSIFEK